MPCEHDAAENVRIIASVIRLTPHHSGNPLSPLTSFDIALLTDRRYEAPVAAAGDWYLSNILQDDELLIAGLRELGLQAHRIDWSRSNVDWHQFRAAVFRTTWDYFDRFAEFREWLDASSAQTQLLNTLSLVRWNMDKHYLADLEKAGIPVVPTRFVECGDVFKARVFLSKFGCDELVVKPCVSGAARHTYRVTRANADEVEARINPLLVDEAFLIQPFQRDVLENGETSLMVFDGRFTHAIKKLPKRGDFRVQDDHGGTVHQYVPLKEEVAFAERAMTACPSLPIYGRADLIRDNRGELAIMELELIEPELWLRFHPPAAKAFAAAIVKHLRGGTD